MTDEKKPEEDEVTEEQLEDVTGGATAPPTTQPISQTKPLDMDTADLANFVSDHTTDTASLEPPRTAGEDQ